jgi:hypothetical protein
MMVSGSFSKLEGSSIHIPSAIRAPLYLSQNMFAVVALRETLRPFPEMIVSTFPTETWPDLWRIELDVADAPGLVARVFSILEEESICVLTQESTSLDGGLQHTIALIADCREYKSDIDLSSQERASIARPSLRGLYARLAIELIDHLVFLDGEWPRIRIRRLSSYHQCYAYLQAGSLSTPAHTSISDGKLGIPEQILDPIFASLGAGREEVRAMVLADSKDRIIRVLFASPNRGVIHVRFFFRNAAGVRSMILRILEAGPFDIVRSRLRQGLFHPPGCLRHAPANEYSTFDVLLRTLHPDPAPTDETLFGIVEQLFQTRLELRPFGVAVQPGELFEPSTRIH